MTFNQITHFTCFLSASFLLSHFQFGFNNILRFFTQAFCGSSWRGEDLTGESFLAFMFHQKLLEKHVVDDGSGQRVLYVGRPYLQDLRLAKEGIEIPNRRIGYVSFLSIFVCVRIKSDLFMELILIHHFPVL